MLAFVAVGFVACKSTKENVSADEVYSEARNEKSKRGGDMAERFAQMDVNKDGKLSKDEVKGPLSRNFDAIDTDNDGFISKEEMAKAPKPKRGNRGQNRN